MALKGISVIELAGLAPAPFCGMVLSDFGASVLRIDKIAGIDADCLSHGKTSIALNLKHAEAIKIMKKLCKVSDVLIDPFRAGVMESLNLGPQVILRDNPRLIYARLSGYGQTGLYSKKAGHDINYISLSGILSLFGRAKEKPTFPVNLAADFGGGGLMCAMGIVMALLERTKSGKGQIVDNSMVHGSAYLSSWFYRSQHLPIWGNTRGNNILDTGSHFYDVYETQDGKYLSVGALEPKFYAELLKGLDLTDDDAPQYGDADEIKQKFTKVFLGKKLEEWLKIFENLDACVSPVLSLDEASKFEHNIEQATFVKGDENGRFFPAPAPILSRTPAEGGRKEPRRGEHTRIVLEDLDYSPEEISTLEKIGVIKIDRLSKL